jgi:hypothetical protein
MLCAAGHGRVHYLLLACFGTADKQSGNDETDIICEFSRYHQGSAFHAHRLNLCSLCAILEEYFSAQVEIAAGVTRVQPLMHTDNL